MKKNSRFIESDLLKTNEDIAPQSRDILRTGKFVPPPYKRL